MSEIPIGKPWADPALSEEERQYAEQMHETVTALVRQGVRLSMMRFKELGVPGDIFFRAAIISLVEVAADEAATFLASCEADDGQVETIVQAYAGLLMVSIEKKVPEWRERYAHMAAAESHAETRQ